MDKKQQRLICFSALLAALAAAAMALSSCRFDILLPIYSSAYESSASEAELSGGGSDTENTDAETREGSVTQTEYQTATEYIPASVTETETTAPAVTYETFEVPEEILPYATEYTYDEYMYDDEKETVSEGRDGLLYGVWTVTLENGVEVSRERTGERREEPTAKIVKTGTVPAHSTVYIAETLEMDYSVSTEYSGELYDDETYVKTVGVKGEIMKVYAVSLYHGSETGRSVYSSETTKEPVTEVIVCGTKKRIVTGVLDFPVPTEYAKTSCVSSWFGPRNLSISPYHYGIDFAVPQGTPIYAADGGIVINAYTVEQTAGTSSWSYGTFILIQHVSDDGRIDMRTIYAHLSKLSVKVGDVVMKGQLIGYSGATGNVTGPHLHFELRIPVNGTYTSQKVNAVDPKSYLPW
ncbi:MAG: peptidoglycan DD-metalloendopeptidase family protein [Clostridia bacterium]|nr:peptidoglycan DD-metalloendopeptidase family protein [Clostridia bacterium]